MDLRTVREIQQAIETLTPQEVEALRAWLDGYPDPIDDRIQSGIAAGRLDNAIRQALRDEVNNHIRPL